MILKKANSKAISFACRNFHYAKSVPCVQYGYNVYNSEKEWCGVIVFGGGANNNLAKSFGYVPGEVLELERVALNGKQEYTSQAVAMALKMLHAENPIVKIISTTKSIIMLILIILHIIIHSHHLIPFLYLIHIS